VTDEQPGASPTEGVAKLAVLASGALGIVVVLSLLLLAWLAVLVGHGVTAACEGGDRLVVPVDARRVPPQLATIVLEAAERYGLGERGGATLAALTKVESDFGRNMGPSSAGAVGWTQFLPSTWQRYGVDADGDGRRDPFAAADAIYAAARYLRGAGAPQDWYAALFAFNHADWYVERVMHQADAYLPLTRSTADALPSASACETTPRELAPTGTRRVVRGGRIVAIPGFPGEHIDERVLPDVEFIVRTYRVAITAGYAMSGHAPGGEHPLGLAIDVVPGPQGTWDDVDRLAAWAEPVPGAPRPPFRFVGYNGDPGHGRGHHLHLSWQHAPTPTGQPPAAWVVVLDVSGRS